MVTGGRHIRTLKTQSDEDEELRALQTDCSTFLCTAMDNYLRCLETGVSSVTDYLEYNVYFMFLG